jgi:hypothetical protein
MTVTVKFALEGAMKRARKTHALCEVGVKWG